MDGGTGVVVLAEDSRDFRLKFETGFSDRQIGQAVGAARSTVQECLSRARAAKVSWPLPAELDKAAHPDSWQYSVLCKQYRRWLSTHV